MQALNLNFYCSPEKTCTSQFLVFRSKVITSNFWKVCTRLPCAIFFRSDYLHWRQQKLEMLISQQEKVVWKRLTLYEILKRGRLLCDTIVFNYVFIYAYLSTFHMLTSTKITKIIWRHQKIFVGKVKSFTSFCSKVDST